MATPVAILAGLGEAVTTGNAAALAPIYSAITRNLAGQNSQRAGLEALVVCAEAALKVRRVIAPACRAPTTTGTP